MLSACFSVKWRGRRSTRLSIIQVYLGKETWL